MKSPPQSFTRFPLTLLFGAPAHVRVLRELVLHGGALSVAQLSQGSGLTMAAVRMALDNLERQRAIRAHGAGRSRVFEAHPSNPLLPALNSLFAAERSQWTTLLEALRAGLDHQQAVRAAWLYGSVARGDDDPSSDLDIAVLAEDDTTETVRTIVEDLIAANSALQASVIVITPEEILRGDVNAGWFDQVARNHKILKGRDPQTEKARCRSSRNAHDRQNPAQANRR